MDSVDSPGATAWPHGKGQRHVLQLVSGFDPKDQVTEKQASDWIFKGFRSIIPNHIDGEFLPNFIDPWYMDVSKVSF